MSCKLVNVAEINRWKKDAVWATWVRDDGERQKVERTEGGGKGEGEMKRSQR
jgi:hypothetical protein